MECVAGHCHVSRTGFLSVAAATRQRVSQDSMSNRFAAGVLSLPELSIVIECLAEFTRRMQPMRTAFPLIR
jgi:hypothetical protein